MAASAAAGNRVGGQTDGTAQPGQRIKTAARRVGWGDELDDKVVAAGDGPGSQDYVVH